MLFLFPPGNLSIHIPRTSVNDLQNNVRNKGELSNFVEHTRLTKNSSYLNGFRKHLFVPLLEFHCHLRSESVRT